MNTMPALRDVVRLADDPLLASWGVAAVLDERRLDRLGDFAGDAFDAARAATGGILVHPTAWVSPLAKVGPDVVIGPGCTVHEFSTVRGHSVLSAGVQVGFGCEITNAVIGQGTRLGHQVCLGYSIVGQGAHLAAALTVASTHLWNPDMGHPDRPVTIRLGDGRSCCTGLPKFGAILGDRVRVGMHVALGPGVVVGADTVIYPGVTAASTVLPAGHVARPEFVSVCLTPRRDLPSCPAFSGAATLGGKR